MALDDLSNSIGKEGFRPVNESENNANDELINKLKLIIKENNKELSASELKILQSALEKTETKIGTKINNVKKETSDRLSNFNNEFKKQLKAFGLDEKFEKKITSLHENGKKLSENFKLLHKETKDGKKQIVSPENIKSLEKELEKQLSNIGPEFTAIMKDDLESAGTDPEKIQEIIDNYTELSTNSALIASELQRTNKGIDSLGKDIKTTSKALLVGTKEIIAPLTSMVSGIFSDIKSLAGDLLTPLQPFINAGKAMYGILSGGKTPEEQAMKFSQDTNKIISKFIPGWWSYEEEKRKDLAEQADKIKYDLINEMTSFGDNNSLKVQSVGKEILSKTDSLLVTLSEKIDIILFEFDINAEESKKKLLEISRSNDDIITNNKATRIETNNALDETRKQNENINNTVTQTQDITKNIDNNVWGIWLKTLASFAYMTAQFLLILPLILFASVVLGFVLLFVLAWIVGGPFREMLITGFKEIMLKAFDWVFNAIDTLLDFISGKAIPYVGELASRLGEMLPEFFSIVVPQVMQLMGTFLVKYVQLIFWKLPMVLMPLIEILLKQIVSIILKLPFLIIESVLKMFGINTDWFQGIYDVIDGVLWLLNPIFKVISFLGSFVIPALLTYMAFMKAWTLATIVWNKMKMGWDAAQWTAQFLFNSQFRATQLRRMALSAIRWKRQFLSNIAQRAATFAAVAPVLVALLPLIAIAAGVAAIIGLVWYFREDIWGLIEPMVMWVWGYLQPIIMSIWDRIITLWNWLTEDLIRLAGVAIGAVLLAPLLPVIAVIYLLWDYIGPLVDWVWSYLKVGFEFIWNGIKIIWDVLKQIGSFILYYATLPMRTVLNVIGGMLPGWLGGGKWGDGLLGLVGVTKPSISGMSEVTASAGSVSSNTDEESNQSKSIAQEVIDGILGLPVINWISSVLKPVIGFISNRIITLWNWLTEDLIRLAGIAIGAVLLAPLLPVIAVIYLLWDYIGPLVDWVWSYLKVGFEFIWNGIKWVWDVLKQIGSFILYYATLPMRTVLNIIGGMLPGWLGGGKWGDGLFGLVGVTKPSISGMSEVTASAGFVSSNTDEEPNQSKSIAQEVIDGILGLPVILSLQGIINWFWNSGIQIVETIWEGIKWVWDTLKNIANIIMYYVTWPLRKGLNAIGDSIPWVGGAWGDWFFNAIGITAPQFEKGGIVTQKTVAVIGEAGDNEAVIPLNERGFKFFNDIFNNLEILKQIKMGIFALAISNPISAITSLFKNQQEQDKILTEKVFFDYMNSKQSSLDIEYISWEFQTLFDYLGWEFQLIEDRAVNIIDPMKDMFILVATFVNTKFEEMYSQLSQIKMGIFALAISNPISAITSLFKNEKTNNILSEESFYDYMNTFFLSITNTIYQERDNIVYSIGNMLESMSNFDSIETKPVSVKIYDFSVPNSEDSSNIILQKLNTIHDSISNIKIPPAQTIKDKNNNTTQKTDPNYELAKYLATGIITGE